MSRTLSDSTASFIQDCMKQAGYKKRELSHVSQTISRTGRLPSSAPRYRQTTQRAPPRSAPKPGILTVQTRRKRSEIELSGAYSVHPAPRSVRYPDRSEMKDRLARRMHGVAPKRSHKPSTPPPSRSQGFQGPQTTREQTRDVLITAMRERQEFLDEMRRLGQGKRYEQEVARELAQLKKQYERL
eukprot:gnl/Dysnectes_brevis/3478_a4408_959.p1 GENE.gnl/Dysnectes_brevis/3478_a4408_959~~gnl/Dysnectes_brevis/3478_a4408_959.p1  ORF type:complete len:185 (-),score=23.67 gnl/Dysnectes_brevis/3478_a4408_959:74-628(-)